MVCWKALAVLVFLPAMSWANPYLVHAKQLYRDQRFQEARAQLEIARQVPGGDDEEKMEVLELLARTQVAEGARSDAKQTFKELLQISPLWTPSPSLSPKIREVFDEAKRELYPPPAVKLSQLNASAGQLRINVFDPGPAFARSCSKSAETPRGTSSSRRAQRSTGGEFEVEAREERGTAIASLKVVVAPLPIVAPSLPATRVSNAKPGRRNRRGQSAQTSLPPEELSHCTTCNALALIFSHGVIVFSKEWLGRISSETENLIAGLSALENR